MSTIRETIAALRAKHEQVSTFERLSPNPSDTLQQALVLAECIETIRGTCQVNLAQPRPLKFDGEAAMAAILEICEQ